MHMLCEMQHAKIVPETKAISSLSSPRRQRHLPFKSPNALSTVDLSLLSCRLKLFRLGVSTPTQEYGFISHGFSEYAQSASNNGPTLTPPMFLTGSVNISPFAALACKLLKRKTRASCKLPGKPVQTSINLRSASTVPCKMTEGYPLRQ